MAGYLILAIIVFSLVAFYVGRLAGRRFAAAPLAAPHSLPGYHGAYQDDMLLSGTLAGGEALSNRAQVVDAPLGKGHVVMFAIRPFWRWQTQGTFFLGFNTILNWNDLDAGREVSTAPASSSGN